MTSLSLQGMNETAQKGKCVYARNTVREPHQIKHAFECVNFRRYRTYSTTGSSHTTTSLLKAIFCLWNKNLFIHSLWNCRRSFFIVFWQKKSKTSFVNFWCHCYAWNFGKISETRWITKMFDVNEKYANMQRSLGHGIILSGAARGIVGRKISRPQTCYNNLNSLNMLPNLIILYYF